MLQECYDLETAALSGSSAGAIVAAFLARGYTPAQTLEMLLTFPYRKIGWNIRRGTLWSLEPLEDELRRLGIDDFGDLQTPLTVTLTPYQRCDPVYMQKGDLARGVLASASLLPLFAPISIEGEAYMDGGFCDNLPVKPLLEYDLFTIAINVNPTTVTRFSNTLLGNLSRAGFMLLNSNIRSSIPLADSYVEIAECQNFGILERKKLEEIYNIGKAQAYKDRKRWDKIFSQNS